jgi:hypothetical protein
MLVMNWERPLGLKWEKLTGGCFWVRQMIEPHLNKSKNFSAVSETAVKLSRARDFTYDAEVQSNDGERKDERSQISSPRLHG